MAEKVAPQSSNVFVHGIYITSYGHILLLDILSKTHHL